MPVWRRFGAEVFGTFALVLVAAGADTVARLSQGEVTVAARAVAPALMVSALIYAFGDVSGAHLNPVVTLAFAVKRLVPLRMVAGYWVAQLTGAVIAAATLRALFGAVSDAGVSHPKLVDAPTAVAVEMLLTLLLVSIVLGTADRARVVGPEAALAVGATIALCGLVAIPLEGASMNPARSAGPALVAGQLGDLWIYIVGPLAGALLATVVSRLLHGAPPSGAREAAQGDDPSRPNPAEDTVRT